MPPDPANTDRAFRALVGLLDEQREALRVLIYRLTVASLLVAEGNDRYVARAGDDVIAAADHVGELELARAVATLEVATACGMTESQPTLREVIAAAPPDYRSMLQAHLDELTGLSAEASELAGVGRELAEGAAGRVNEAIDRLETLGTSGPYGSEGSSGSPPSAFFDGTA